MKLFRRFRLRTSRHHTKDKMRSLRKKSGGTELAAPEIPEQQTAKPRTAKFPFKLSNFRKSLKKTDDTCSLPVVVLTFEGNLEQGHLSQAGKQLIQQEENLFGREIGKEEKESREHKEKLNVDYDALLQQIWLSLDSSLSARAEGLEHLKSAVSCIQQEEEQDRRWLKDPGSVHPAWRPRKCRQTHDSRLEKMVEKRMEELDGVDGGDNLTSLKRDICKMGIRVKEDLLKVARDLNNIYPEEFDICNVYTRLYHEAFSKRLMKITEFELDVDDCAYLLSWVNDHYPNGILKHPELKEKINCTSLGNLLPVEVTKFLEEQYLSEKETTVKMWVSTALRQQEEAWLSGNLPKLTEGHCSSISIDVIQCVDTAVRDARIVVGGPHKAQPIMCQLKCFLMSYKKSLEDFLKGKHGNTREVITANLASLEQFENYIVKESDSFAEETKTYCLSLVNAMKDCGYQYLINIIHANMKVQYRKLGTQSWLSENGVVMKGLLEGLKGHIEKSGDLKPSCCEELVGRLHGDVMVEFVKRLLKRKLKLKDKGQQEAAARLLCENSKELHSLFTEQGSKEEWLEDILPKIAEVLKSQDPSIMQLDIVTLARDYPDLSDRHVSELLHLKTNLTTFDIKMIKESLSENRTAVISQNTRPFFSRVLLKWNIMRLPH